MGKHKCDRYGVPGPLDGISFCRKGGANEAFHIVKRLTTECDRMRKLLEQLNREGGLGAEKHARIDAAIAPPSDDE